MADSPDAIDSSARWPIIVADDAPLEAGLIFASIGSSGTRRGFDELIVERLSIAQETPTSDELAGGYAFQRLPDSLLCYVVTEDEDSLPERALDANMRRALADAQVEGTATWWVPLMGTGSGELSPRVSFDTILKVLAEAPPIIERRATAVISIPSGLDRIERGNMSLRAFMVSQRILGGEGGADLPGRSDAVTAALTLATRLAGLPGDTRSSLSTSLLFFALAESQSAAAPAALRDDLAAQSFAGAVHALAGARYGPAWHAYFKSDARLPPSDEPVPELLRPTENAEKVLSDAQSLAVVSGDRAIGVDHLARALIGLADGRMRRVLQRMEIEPEALLAEYEEVRSDTVFSRLQNDVVSEQDRLGAQRYARAIQEFLTDKHTEPPLSISIQAPWGGGKSTLMTMVREGLDPKEERERNRRLPGLRGLLLQEVLPLLNRRRPETEETAENRSKDELMPGRRWTIWFNVWKYQTTEQVWAGLVDAIVSQVAERLPLRKREEFYLRLQVARIDDGIIRRRIYDRVLTTWWARVRAWTLLGVSATLALFGLGAVEEALPGPVREALALWQGGGGSGFASAIGAQIVLSAYLVGSYFLSRSATRKEPAELSLADYIRVPDYDKSLGELHQIHADLHRVLKTVPKLAGGDKPAPLVVFIDDLDRCSPDNVAKVVEGVSMLLANTDHRCMFVIGMDPQMVAAALEKAHEQVRDKLPGYERAVPLGWRFMDKFIQLPFTVPPPGQEEFDGYVDWLVNGTKPESETGPALVSVPVSSPATAPMRASGPASSSVGASATVSEQPPAAALARAEQESESRDVEQLVRLLGKHSVGNPREMKRMVNLARFYLALRGARRRRDMAWRAPRLDTYARWIAMTLRWPDMMRWLLWGADETQWSSDESGEPLPVRRLMRLEILGSACAAVGNWHEALEANFKVSAADRAAWASDVRLYEFFRDSRAAEQEKLSDAVRHGFW